MTEVSHGSVRKVRRSESRDDVGEREREPKSGVLLSFAVEQMKGRPDLSLEEHVDCKEKRRRGSRVGGASLGKGSQGGG